MKIKATKAFLSPVFNWVNIGDILEVQERTAHLWVSGGQAEYLEEPKPDNVEWRDLHWKKKIALAKEVYQGDVANKEEAELILEDHYG